MISKRCPKCGETLPVDAFCIARSNKKDGRGTYCYPCDRLRAKQWRIDNPRKQQQYKKRYRELNSLKTRQQVAAWKANNPARVKAAASNGRAVARGQLLNKLTGEQVEAKFAYWGYRCWMCGKDCGSTRNLHLDHVYPLARGGLNIPANIRPSCADCNIGKNARHPFMVAAFDAEGDPGEQWY